MQTKKELLINLMKGQPIEFSDKISLDKFIAYFTKIGLQFNYSVDYSDKRQTRTQKVYTIIKEIE